MSSEANPLLPRHEHSNGLHHKLHTYDMLRALSEGYIPSTEQAIAILRALLASDVLNLPNQEIGSAGRAVVPDASLRIQALIGFLQDKNAGGQLQGLLWHLSRSRVELDRSRISQPATHAKTRADTKAAYDSLRTIGGLLVTNADFRLFMDDIVTVGRQIFVDTALSLAETSKQVAEQVHPSEEEEQALQGAGVDQGRMVSGEEIEKEVEHIFDVANTASHAPNNRP